MSPSAEPTTNDAPAAAYLVPADLLGENEIIVLALKPSVWFVLVTSLPILASLAVVTAAAYVAKMYYPQTPAPVILFFVVAIGLLRMLAACWQWLGRTYVLTNRRIVCLRGVVKTSVQAEALTEIKRAALAASLAERTCGAGSIFCLTAADAPAADGWEADLPARSVVTWAIIANPHDVHEIVQMAIDRARRMPPTDAAGEQ